MNVTKGKKKNLKKQVMSHLKKTMILKSKEQDLQRKK